MEFSMGMWLALVLGGLPLLGLFLGYGDGAGMYRSHLFGSPCIITCFPAVNKFVFQSLDTFILDWPTVDLLGRSSLVAVHGKPYARLRRYVTNAINQPDALRRFALFVQPRMVALYFSHGLRRVESKHMMKLRR
ncbi:PREDICTED: ent-kaurenoic acid [Prunus dulcis]|uniref:PREDICTED: ent-kaurenoic acid n=1 Tax=Prunus dulcis TaxID=3755 RepID=A0A5E4FP62_PRUDU|nr:PREDICTED: ent-kaurenoic acid [Prunus dulcis]